MLALVHAAQYLRYAREAAAAWRAPAGESCAAEAGEALDMVRTWIRLSEAALDQASLDDAAPLVQARRRGSTALSASA
ncbi:MAG TPA: hypothetical protein VLI41_05175 [Phenylobacterium sp.]|uniref:hypothetical protein n=1 Tax=Phenylobacterium sp. TaxID=1871053 RepID=UPI002CECC377|nr:hypothetical protein [Phenylobacterium sp.]HSV02578.1 hypothetical protein [Phenylobacterium sp.]